MKKIILPFLLNALLISVTFGQSIFTNPITGTNPNDDNPYITGQTVTPFLTVSGIGRGSGISGSDANDRYNASGWTTATSINTSDYFEFILTPGVNGNGIQTNIDFTSFVYTGQRSSQGPTSFAFRSSVDNFVNNIGTPTSTGATISLSGADYQNIASEITFRLYGWNAGGGGGTFSVNSFTFNAVGGVLPVAFTGFEGKTNATSTLLSFTTATELNNNYFAIERSSDGRTFQQVGEVKGAGTTYTKQDYTFTDEKPLRGINYYRLKQVDFDGQFTYSSVVSVQFGKVGNVVIYPTPATETVNVRLEENLATDAQWQIIDMTGRIVSEGVFAAEQLQYSLPVATLTQGAYVLRVTAEQEVLTQQFRKQ